MGELEEGACVSRKMVKLHPLAPLVWAWGRGVPMWSQAPVIPWKPCALRVQGPCAELVLAAGCPTSPGTALPDKKPVLPEAWNINFDTEKGIFYYPGIFLHLFPDLDQPPPPAASKSL